MELPRWLLKGNPTYRTAGKDAERAYPTFAMTRLENGKTLTGGRGFITKDRELVFEPLDAKPALKALRWGLFASGVPGTGLGKRAIEGAGLLDPQISSLRNATSIEVVDAKLTRPPVVRASLDNGKTIEFGVLAGPLFSNRDKENKRTANDVAAQLRAQLLLGPG